MSARGNSGVILSQIVRGICEVWGRSDDLATADFKEALAEGASSAYRAVKEPVEGTMLTVIREMAMAAQGVPDTLGLDKLLMAVEEAGRVAVENTTAQLPALQKAGVVDAGGYGLLVLFRGLAAGIAELTNGGITLSTARVALHSGETAAPPAHEDRSELSAFRYCASLLISGEALDQDAFEAFLLSIGDSTLVVGDERMVKVHVQTKANDERLQQRASQVVDGTVVVAVVVGEGNKRLFRELGCHAVVDGGQSMNPSAAQLLEAVDKLGAEEVVVLPNNGNVILTAEQAAGMSSRHIAVVPSASLPLGLAAMLAFDPEGDAVGNARAMQDAIADVHSAEVTRAVRDSELDGVAVLKDQAIGIVDGRLVAAAKDLQTAFAGVLAEFAREEADYVTVLTALNGSGVTREALEELSARALPDAEVHFHEGGQPLYPILASAE